MPDATGLELIAQGVRDRHGDEVVVGTSYFREQATLEVKPEAVKDVIAGLREAYPFLMSVHGCDYLPEEPRFGIHYQLLNMRRPDRLNVKTRVGLENCEVPSIVEIHPGADHQEREVYDMFGVVFTGHPDLRRILMPEDYEGHPQRRDFPIGGEPVLFTFNEKQTPRWYD